MLKANVPYGKARMNGICIPKVKFIAEHKKLIDTLKNGTKEEQKKEALEQGRELRKFMKF
jgi:hypothetical protein